MLPSERSFRYQVRSCKKCRLIQLWINIRSAKILTHLSRTLESWTFALDYLFSIAVRITTKDNITSGLPFRSELRGNRSKRLIVSRVIRDTIFMGTEEVLRFGVTLLVGIPLV